MAYQATTVKTSPAALGARFLLTLAGAAALIVGAFLNWTQGTAGTSITNRALWSTTMSGTQTFFMSAGAIMIGLGLVALLGSAMGTGWLTRLAGAAGMIAFVLFAIELFRAPGSQQIQIGAWLCGAGAVTVTVAGWFGRSTTTVTRKVPPSSDRLP
jgi:hypothetical protein